jgi:CheY-like chemotaxis protein
MNLTHAAFYLTARQVCAALRAAGVALPIVAMTGNVDPGSVALFKRVGFNALLAKPFSQVCAHVLTGRRNGVMRTVVPSRGVPVFRALGRQDDVARLLAHVRGGGGWWSNLEHHPGARGGGGQPRWGAVSPAAAAAADATK